MSVPTQPEGTVEAVYIPARVQGRKLVLTPAAEDQTDHFILINKLPQWHQQQQKRDYSVGVYLIRW